MKIKLAFLSLLVMSLFSAPAFAQMRTPDPEAVKAFEELIASYRQRPGLTIKTTVKIQISGKAKRGAIPQLTDRDAKALLKFKA